MKPYSFVSSQSSLPHHSGYQRYQDRVPVFKNFICIIVGDLPVTHKEQNKNHQSIFLNH